MPCSSPNAQGQTLRNCFPTYNEVVKKCCTKTSWCQILWLQHTLKQINAPIQDRVRSNHHPWATRLLIAIFGNIFPDYFLMSVPVTQPINDILNCRRVSRDSQVPFARLDVLEKNICMFRLKENNGNVEKHGKGCKRRHTSCPFD